MYALPRRRRPVARISVGAVCRSGSTNEDREGKGFSVNRKKTQFKIFNLRGKNQETVKLLLENKEIKRV